MAKVDSAFIAYRHTGEDPVVLETMLGGICDEFDRLTIDAYCTFFSEQEFQNKSAAPKEIMQHAFKMIEGRDLLFVILANEAKSEGMIMEVGRFYGKKPIIMAVKEGVSGTYLPGMADVAYTWSNQAELCKGVEQALQRLGKK